MNTKEFLYEINRRYEVVVSEKMKLSDDSHNRE